jgi:hypothetical protein
MRRLFPLLVILAGASCVDLTPPPELARAPGNLPDLDGEAPDVASVEVGGSPVDAGAPEPDAALATDQAAAADMDIPAPDAGVSTDATVPPDTSLPADVPVAPDVTADRFVAPPDLAPDVAPVMPDVAPVMPDVAPDRTPDLALDMGPPPLVVDDFQGSATNRNTLGSSVTFDHETCNHVNGESVCSYAGSGGFHDFIESFNNFCPFDASRFTKLRFRMRTSVAGEMVEVYAGSGPCNNEGLSKIGTVTTTTTMTTYDLDLTTVNRALLVSIEFDPLSANSSIQFILDDIQLVP